MIVYVEFNFMLELALGQEQSAAAEAILAGAEQGKLILAFAEFAVSEPFATLTQRGKRQLELSKRLGEELRQLQRSKPHQPAISTILTAPAILSSVAQIEADRLRGTVERLLASGTALHLDSAAFNGAVAYQLLYQLAPQDSIIYAVVVADLRARPSGESKVFISRNWKDFRSPDILAELQSHNCAYAESFDEGLALINAQP
ncbi:MAG TPA: hypothetical protein VF116_05350 [Ktedonobacterales bacterium]